MRAVRTLAVDFDGVIHAYSRGWQDGTIYDGPVPGAFDALRELRQRYDVVIYTTRASETEPYPATYGGGWGVRASGVLAIQRWFREQGAADLADLRITHHKPLAVAYIDDRAIRFTNWQETLFAVRVLHPPEGP